MKPADVVPAWPTDNAYERAQQCALFLLAHDFISPGERAKIHRRMVAWVTMHQIAAKPTDGPTKPETGGAR